MTAAYIALWKDERLNRQLGQLTNQTDLYLRASAT